MAEKNITEGAFGFSKDAAQKWSVAALSPHRWQNNIVKILQTTKYFY